MIRLKVRNFEVEKLVGESKKLRIYTGKSDNGDSVILKVAKTYEDGSILTKEAGKFTALQAFADKIDKFETKRGGDKAHYDWLFAKLIASFMEPTQNDRQINVFTTPDINLGKLVPLAKLHKLTEIDARSSVWILGRLFKFYSLFELIAADEFSSIAKYPAFSPGNFLIGPDRHRVIYYNFTEDIADVVATNFVKAIADIFIDWVVIEDDLFDRQLYELIEDFSAHGRNTFMEAHGDLYELVEQLWGIQYHPFTYRDRNTTIWKTIKEE